MTRTQIVADPAASRDLLLQGGPDNRPTLRDAALRYIVVGTNVYDSAAGRVAKFQHAGVAQIGADWLNTPGATPEDYEWSDASAEDWDGYASHYLAAHPEISAAVPSWAEEVDLSTIDDELEGTLFSFSTNIGDVELYGSGRLALDGTVWVHNGGVPSIYLPNELDGEKCPDITQRMLSLAQNLIAGATLLRSAPRLLRRSAATEDQLREREQ